MGAPEEAEEQAEEQAETVLETGADRVTGHRCTDDVPERAEDVPEQAEGIMGIRRVEPLWDDRGIPHKRQDVLAWRLSV